MSDPTTPRRKVLVWDLPTRLFHWLIVLGVLGSWLTVEVVADFDLATHKLIGYAILGLLVFRLLWGFVGGRHSRFLNFVRGPGAVFGYLRVMGRRDAPAHGGHNPLGALSVLALLASLLVQVVTGLMNQDEVLANGPLAPVVGAGTRSLAGQIHEINFTVLLVLIGIHLLAVAYYVFWQRTNLVTPMITGRAALPESEAGTTPPAWRFLLVLAIAVGVVLLVVLGLPAWLEPAAGGGNSFD